MSQFEEFVQEHLEAGALGAERKVSQSEASWRFGSVGATWSNDTVPRYER